jgi:hypothetical protein
MSRELKMGDRIRVRRTIREYQVGDKGIVLEGPSTHGGAAEKSYVVMMDKDGPGATSIVFTEGDIELDRGP